MDITSDQFQPASCITCKHNFVAASEQVVRISHHLLWCYDGIMLTLYASISKQYMWKYKDRIWWPRQKGRLFADDTFKRIFLNENIRISTKNSLKFVPKGRINNIPALVLIMAWRRPGDKPLSEPMLVRSLTHICVTRPQWVKRNMQLSLIDKRETAG